MKHFTSKTQKVGELGEKICAAYLVEKGFTIRERNFTKRSGEIDIVAEKDNAIHFIEVKSINADNVSYETYNPAENFTKDKYFKVYRTTKEYIQDHAVSHETKWQIDLYCVFINNIKNNHKISKIENVVFT